MSAGAHAESLSITRLEGSRWRGGRLWSWNQDPRAWSDVDREAGGARATATPTGLAARVAASVRAGDSSGGSTRTSPETWAITGSKTATLTGVGGHELSKLHVRVARWRAERMGPTIIAAPHRGHDHVAHVSVAVVTAAVAYVDVAAAAGVASRVRASATRATRQVLARKPDCRMRTKPRGRMCWTKRRRNSIADS